MVAAKRVMKNTLFLYIKMGISVFSSLYTTRLILNALGEKDFGLFTLIAGLISMLLFLNSAMSVSSQRFMSFAKGKNDLLEEKYVFNISIILHLMIAASLVLLLELVGPFLFDSLLKIDLDKIEIAKIIYQFMIVSTVFTVLSVPYDAVINANEDMFFVAILGIFESLIKLVIAIYITQITNDRLITYGYLIAIISGILLIVKFFYTRIQYEEVKINFLKYFHKKLFKKMLSFASYTLIGISTQMITTYGQGIVLNMFFGTIVNAAQGIVSQVSGQLNVFAMTMLKALNPMITKSEGSGNRKLMIDASFIGMKMSFYLVSLFYIPVLFEMPTIFRYWLVNIPEYTISFGILLLIRNLIEQLYVTLYTSILSVGNIKNFQVGNAVLNLMPLPIAYYFFQLGYPPQTIYIIFIFYTIFQASIYIYYARKECEMSLSDYFYRVVFKSLLPFSIIVMIVWIPHSIITDDLFRVITVLIVNFLSFSFIIWKFGLSSLEKEFVQEIIKKIINKVKR